MWLPRSDVFFCIPGTHQTCGHLITFVAERNKTSPLSPLLRRSNALAVSFSASACFPKVGVIRRYVFGASSLDRLTLQTARDQEQVRETVSWIFKEKTKNSKRKPKNKTRTRPWTYNQLVNFESEKAKTRRCYMMISMSSCEIARSACSH